MRWKGCSPPFHLCVFQTLAGWEAGCGWDRKEKILTPPLLGGKCGNTLMRSTILDSDGKESHCCCNFWDHVFRRSVVDFMSDVGPILGLEDRPKKNPKPQEEPKSSHGASETEK